MTEKQQKKQQKGLAQLTGGESTKVINVEVAAGGSTVCISAVSMLARPTMHYWLTTQAGREEHSLLTNIIKKYVSTPQQLSQKVHFSPAISSHQHCQTLCSVFIHLSAGDNGENRTSIL